MLAVKHFDPVVGIDVHIVLLPTPAGPIPTPLPMPFIGMVFDPVDYLPLVGATVKVNGLPRAHAGTGVFALPVHVPLAGPFLKPPGNEGELFMGSTTVEVDGEPMSFANVPVLTCQDLGVPPPPRSTKTRTVRHGGATHRDHQRARLRVPLRPGAHRRGRRRARLRRPLA